jgi:hypothetical protein
MEINSFLLPPSPVCFQFSVPCLLFCFFFFFAKQEVILPWGLCWFIPGMAGGKLRDAWHSPVGLPNVSQAGLEPAHGGAATYLFSQCKVA